MKALLSVASRGVTSFQKNTGKIGLALGMAAGLAACSGSNSGSGYSLPSVEFSTKQFFLEDVLLTDNALATVAVGGTNLSFTQNPGSGAFRSTKEDSNLFYTISDRGPSFPCDETSARIGQSNFCGGGNTGRVFPLGEGYTPSITAWKLTGISTKLSLEKLYSLELRDDFGGALSGIPNERTTASTETAYDKDGAVIQPDPNGVDPEALVKLSNGRFWVAEQYGPSLLLVEEDGTVSRRELPAGADVDYASSTVTVNDSVLPKSLRRRDLDGGIAALALSPNEDFLYYVTKSPLDSPNANSRVIRIAKLALDSDGNITSLEGEYLYRLDTPDQYGVVSKAGSTTEQGDLESGQPISQSEITVNEAVALDEDLLVIVEQGRKVSKYYRVNLATATSITDTVWETATGSASAENQYLIEDVPFVTKQLGIDTLSYVAPRDPDLPSTASPNTINLLEENIEGFAMLNSNFALLSNDNNWGLDGVKGRLAVMPLGAFVVSSTLPYRPQLSYTGSGDLDLSGFSPKAVAADSTNSQLFVIDGQSSEVKIFDLTDPLSPVVSTGSLDIAAAATASGITAGAAQAVAVGSGYVAVAFDASNPQTNGMVAVYRADTLAFENSFEIGAAPRAMAFGLLGGQLVIANSGEPSDDYSTDPLGSITIVDYSSGLDVATATTLNFEDFNTGGSRAAELDAEVRVFGDGSGNTEVAEDLQPEAVSLALDGVTAFISMPINNAVAVIDLANLEIDTILALGGKDFGQEGYELDVENNGTASLDSWPGVVGMFQPGDVGAYQYQSKNYFVTANTGKARENSAFTEVTKAENLSVDPNNDSAGAAASGGELANLTVSDQTGDGGDGTFEEITAFGGRSFAIWDAEGSLIYDSGSDMARTTLALLGEAGFNDGDSVSEDRGAQPNSISLVASLNRIYAFITLETTGGVIIYDITSPYGVQFVQYVNNRDFAGAGDLSPQGVSAFFQSSIGYLAVPNAQSNNVRIFQVEASK
ncbi:choice-of-anchor I family protein [Spongiibacter sp. KMU-158]|uniref:Choice-of-anchor I family protein n=1 Tax=Spongiibacter pelagi TaxID=2760804 RepID=A0A927C2Z7_9GAMM|nr:choice-of-anchor I family protein [Spongiibacter pelagi]MBD2858831.1 choice-of-anchor I family protein [Spongiibacter pelagi]